MSLIDGPRLPPHAGGPADALVVLLHGHGADGRDLIDIGTSWREILPNAAFVAPHGPEPAPGPMGRRWFELMLEDPRELAIGAEAALPGLSRFLAKELAAHGLPWRRLALFGFSQGAMMALSYSVAAPEPLGAVVGVAGLYPPPPGGVAPARSVSPTLLIHGSEDDVIPAGALFASAAMLDKAGVPVEWHLSHGVEHTIDEACLYHAGVFMADCLSAGS
ncbi:alpha/beta hydrolase [Xanthobacteraceae bacterium A53D]